MWNWSGGIDISSPKTVNFLIRNRNYFSNKNFSDYLNDQIKSVASEEINLRDTVYLKAVISKETEILYISIYQLNQENYAYRLNNHCKNFTIFFKQACISKNSLYFNENEDQILLKDSSLPFAWIYPNEPPELEVVFKHISERIENNNKFYFNLTRLSETSKRITLISTKSKKRFIIICKYIFEGPTITLYFSEENPFDELNKNIIENEIRRNTFNFANSANSNDINVCVSPRKNKMDFNKIELKKTPITELDSLGLSLPSEPDAKKESFIEKNKIQKIILIYIQVFGVSIIGKNKTNKNIEILYLYATGLEFALMEEKNFKTFQFRIKYLNLDNNSQNNPFYPVIMTPSLKEKYLGTSDDAKRSEYFDAIIKYNHNSEQVFFNYNSNSKNINILDHMDQVN